MLLNAVVFPKPPIPCAPSDDAAWKLPRHLRTNPGIRRTLSGLLIRLSSSKYSKSNTRLEGKEGISKWRFNPSVGEYAFCSIFSMFLLGLITSITRRLLRTLGGVSILGDAEAAETCENWYCLLLYDAVKIVHCCAADSQAVSLISLRNNLLHSKSNEGVRCSKTWAAISKRGKSNLVFVNRYLNAHAYNTLLMDHLFNLLNKSIEYKKIRRSYYKETHQHTLHSIENISYLRTLLLFWTGLQNYQTLT